MIPWDWIFAGLLVLAVLVGLIANLLKPPAWVRQKHLALAFIILFAVYVVGTIYLRVEERSAGETADYSGQSSTGSPQAGSSSSATPSATSSPANTYGPSISSEAFTRPTPPQVTLSSPAISQKTAACNALRNAALSEEDALRGLRNSVITGSGVIQGAGPDYSNRYQAAVMAVDTAYTRLTGFQQAGGTLPALGGGDVDYETDLGRLQDHELRYVNDGVTRNASYDETADYYAWNELKVYADSAHLVGVMQCG
jgi:hypothetical protein